MRRNLTAAIIVLVAASLLGLWLFARPAQLSKFDIVVDGKPTVHAGIVGRITTAGDAVDARAFGFRGLHKFVYAGAGVTIPNARIHVRLSIDKLDGTGAGVLVNGHWFGFDAKPGNSSFGAGEVFGAQPTAFADAADHLQPGQPFDFDFALEDGTLTHSINGKVDYSEWAVREPLFVYSRYRGFGTVRLFCPIC